MAETPDQAHKGRARFLAPIAGWRDRVAAWFDLLIIDLGILRLLWKNRAPVGKRAFRMNQPFPIDLVWALKAGVRTVISARHDKRHGGHALEADAAEALGLSYIVLDEWPIFSRGAPYRQSILRAVEIFRAAEQPVLIHCKSGADRAGFLAALWLITMENVPVEQARAELSLRFLHVRTSKTGKLDAVFDTYLADTAAHPKSFLDWVAEDYDHTHIEAAFKPTRLGDLVDRLLRRE